MNAPHAPVIAAKPARSASGANEIVSFGCRLNLVETEAMRAMLGEAGAQGLLVVNTCAVTGEAVRQARQTIRRAAREAPDRRIVVTGCAAQIDPEAFAAMPEVALVLGNAEKLEKQTWQKLALGPDLPLGGGETEKIQVNDIFSARETAGHLLEGFDGQTRAIVQVQNGCDHRCTFCVIPFGRGASRSVPMGEAVAQIGRLAENGYREIVLSGVDLSDYGKDLPGAPKLGRLVEAILRHVPKIARLRLSSIDSIEVDPVLLDLLKSERRLMPHLHLSLQSGDNLILKRMKRRHAREDALALCEALRKSRPDFSFGADLIAGFPTEDGAMHANSLRLIDEIGIAFLHVFPFSARPGTPAARMPALDGARIKARAAELRAAGAAVLKRHLAARVGRRLLVLAERNRLGRLEDFTPVRLPEGIEPGSLIDLRMIASDGTRLIGAPAPQEAPSPV